MQIDLDDLPANEQYKLLAGTIVPRPIALITTQSPEGVVNAAPFSFFGILGEDPALLVVGIKHHPDGRAKDTARNILQSGEFVVHMVDEALAEAMNACAIDVPPDVSEIALAGLTLAPSAAVLVPQITQAPVAFECKLFQKVEGIADRAVIIGRIVRMHLRDTLYDAQKKRIRLENYRPIGRMTGSAYVRTSDLFTMERPFVDQSKD